MRQTAEYYWKDCLTRFSKLLAPQVFKTWFDPIVPSSLRREGKRLHLTLEVPSRFFYEWLEKRYSQTISDVVGEVIGRGTRVHFRVVAQEPVTESREVQVSATDAAQPNRAPHVRIEQQLNFRTSANSISPIDSRLNPTYTFDRFIEGDCNRLARSAASAIADQPGKTSFNPFLIYGGVGLGKTHLAQAIGNEAISQGWKGRALYVSSEKFTTQFVQAIQQNRIADFTRFYRQIDLLIVDDIQFFGGKEKTQEEFFHIFNDLHQSGRQIVLSADRPPRDIDGIEERLLSRFQWGLSADVRPPDLETRTAILRRKAEATNMELDPDVIDFVAHRIKSNVRTLEGALIKLAAHSRLHGRPVDIELAASVLKDVVDHSAAPMKVEEIKRIVAEYYRTDIDLLSAKTRKREIVQARQIAMYCCKRYTQLPLKTIGLRFGGRDHSTVIHACRSVENRIDVEPGFKAELESINDSILLKSRTGS